MHELFAAIMGKNTSVMHLASSGKWPSTEIEHFLAWHIWKSRYRADLRAHNRVVDCLDRQIYNITNVKHGFQINWYCELQNIQNHFIGCWKRDFYKIQSTNCINKSLIWIDQWSHWATPWQPAKFRQVGRIPLNRTRVDSWGYLTTHNANLAAAWFGHGPQTKLTVQRPCL